MPTPFDGQDHHGACTPKTPHADEDRLASSFKMCVFNAHSVAKKAHVLSELFIRGNLMFLFLTET